MEAFGSSSRLSGYNHCGKMLWARFDGESKVLWARLSFVFCKNVSVGEMRDVYTRVVDCGYWVRWAELKKDFPRFEMKFKRATRSLQNKKCCVKNRDWDTRGMDDEEEMFLPQNEERDKYFAERELDYQPGEFVSEEGRVTEAWKQEYE